MFEIINTFKALRKLRTDEQGVTALEYGLIAGVVGVAVITFGQSISTFLTGLMATLTTAMAGA